MGLFTSDEFVRTLTILYDRIFLQILMQCNCHLTGPSGMIQWRILKLTYSIDAFKMAGILQKAIYIWEPISRPCWLLFFWPQRFGPSWVHYPKSNNNWGVLHRNSLQAERYSEQTMEAAGGKRWLSLSPQQCTCTFVESSTGFLGKTLHNTGCLLYTSRCV